MNNRPELNIKIEYLKDRSNPSEIFEAMAIYINAYRDFGQILSESLDINVLFDFQLNDIKNGSIITKLSTLPGKLDAFLESAFYKAGNELFLNLVDVDNIKDEEQIEQIAARLENSLADDIPNNIADPHVDRKKLSFSLEKFAIANKKIKPNESVIFSTNNSFVPSVKINTKMRFSCNPNEMFLGKVSNVEVNDKLYVIVSVNEGNSVWTFRSISMNRRFSGRIANKEWLENYQNGLIRPIGPKDLIEVKLTYDLYTPENQENASKIRNVKITEIININRVSGFQYEIDA
ncbi:hypothetical protein WKG84_12660 [Pantoea agglomerans]|uniref:hypothetical protein n=1 Tax=Pantoea TaxID=53335 RepID=UPI00351D6FEB